MGRKLHDLLGALKDKASLTAATLTAAATTTTTTTSPISPSLAVLRATSHHPSTSPPSPSHLSALLAFGGSSRLSSSALIGALSSRLASARDPSVALKSLLSIHHLLSHGSFILLDTLTSSLSPSSGRRSPLNLSSFRHPSSLPLSSWVRFYARLIELLLSLQASPQLLNEHSTTDAAERLSSLLNWQLVLELEALVAVMEEIGRAPDTMSLEQNALVVEVARRVEEERVSVQQGILVRFHEVKERVGELGFADCVEVVCLMKRLEECGRVKYWKGWDCFWREVKEVGERVEEVMVRTEEEEGDGRVSRRREKVGDSARVVGMRRLSEDSVRFSSCRWLQ